jgi:hypothetical protein
LSDVANAAPGGAAGDSSPISVITPAADTPEFLSLSEAARVLSTARKPKDQDNTAPVETPQADPVEQESAQADADPQAEEPSEDAPEAEPAQPPIEPPRSWTKDAKERWSALPRETQEYLAQREQERDREVRRSQNEAAEQRKAFDAERSKVDEARKEYEAKLPAIMQALQEAQAGAFPDVKTMEDVTRLAQEDPFRYLNWQAHQQKLAAVNHELEQAKTRQAQEQQSKWAEHVRKENELFAEKVPEVADKAKAAELTSKAVEQLHEIGFSDQELANLASGKDKLSIYDHRVQLLILGNLKLSDLQKAKTAAVSKPLPPVIKPGTAKAPGAAASEQVQALTRKLETSGSLRDAAALRMAQLSQRRRASS